MTNTAQIADELLDGGCSAHNGITRIYASYKPEHDAAVLAELASLIQSVHSQGKPTRRGTPATKTPSGQPRARLVS